MLISKKYVALVLSVLILVGLLSGCANSAKTQETTAQVSTTAAQESSAKAELPEVKLNWYVVGNWPQPEQDKVFAEVNKSLKEKINATVDFKSSDYNTYEQKISVVIASGEDYDLCFTSNWLNNYTANVTKGAFAPLDDLLAQYAPKAYASVSKSAWDAARVKGKIYGFINQQIFARIAALSIPKEYCEKYGLDINTLSGKINPFTLNLLEPIIENMRKYEPEASCGPTVVQLGPEFFGYDFIAGYKIPAAVKLDDAGMKVVNQYDTEELKVYAKTMRDWNSKGYTDSENRLANKTDNVTKAASIYMIMMGGTYKPGGAILDSKNQGLELEQVPTGKAALTTSGIIATMHAINRNSNNPERSMMLLELLNTDQELYNTLNFGIKDEHFTLDSEGFLVKEGDKAANYAPNVPWMFATNFLAYIDKGMPKTLWEDTKKINDTAMASPLLGFNFDSEPVKSEISKTSAVVDEYIRSIELGIASEEVYNEFLLKLKNAGSEAVVNEAQKQIDAWKATR